MKTLKFNVILLSLAVVGLTISGCKKEKSSTSGNLPGAQINQMQNSDAQDAVADKTDQDIDKTADQLQVSNYKTPIAKAYSTSGSLVITVNHPDSTTFPKVITLVYTNYQDSTETESFVKNGEVDITVNASGGNKLLISRAFVFKNFSVTTDSTTFTVNGTRNMVRQAITFKFNGLKGARLTTTDDITANLRYAITKTGVSDTLKFTRVVSKLRKAYLHFGNFGGILWRNAILSNNIASDTVTFSGVVTGLNEKGDNYSKIVGASTPLIVEFFKGTPVITSGVLDYSVTGASAVSFTVTFKEDPNHPRMTLITVTNNSTMESYSFDRRFSRKFKKWW